MDELPPDQRAALSLLLRQRKSYADLATLLGIPEGAVRARAHAALAVLAPSQARELTPERRQDIGDYLLEQQSIAERLLTRSQLSGSQPDRAWAQAISAELAPLASGALPEIPAATAAGSDAAGASLRGLSADSSPASALATPAAGPPTSSRLGGALLLAAIIVAIVVAVILISGNSGGSHSKTSSSVASSTTSSAPGSGKTSTTASAPAVTQRLALHSPDPASRSLGVVEVLQENGKRAFYIAAEHLPPSRGFFYAIWLYNSHSSALPLSKSPAVGSNERLAGGALLPASAGSYREILLTRETSDHPTHPGSVVLRGAFSLGG